MHLLMIKIQASQSGSTSHHAMLGPSFFVIETSSPGSLPSATTEIKVILLRRYTCTCIRTPVVIASYPGPFLRGGVKGPDTHCMCMRGGDPRESWGNWLFRIMFILNEQRSLTSTPHDPLLWICQRMPMQCLPGCL